jgi:preprotein translocase subunit SecG
MEIVLRVLQVFLALGLIGVVLLQRSEGGGLGIGSSGGMGSFMSVRGTANFLTRVTAILAGLFMAVCLIMALLAKPAVAPKSIFDTPGPTTAPLTQAPVIPSETPTPPVAPAPAAMTPATAPVAPVAPAPVSTVDPAMKKAPQTGTAPKSGQ